MQQWSQALSGANQEQTKATKRIGEEPRKEDEGSHKKKPRVAAERSIDMITNVSDNVSYLALDHSILYIHRLNQQMEGI